MANITLQDLMREARSVPTYRGDGTYELSSYLSEAEAIIGLAPDENTRTYILNIIATKLQGEAAMSIRGLPDARTWLMIKTQLIKSFGVQETYLKLKDKADNIKFSNVSQYYYELRSILDKLNLKYKLDPRGPVEFNPHNNEQSILEKFYNKIHRSDSMYLRMKNIATLEEAHFELIQTGLNDHAEFNSNKNKLTNSQNNMNFKNNFQNKTNNFNQNQRNVYPQRYNNFNQQQYNNFNHGNSSQQRFNNNHGNLNQPRYNNFNPGNSSQQRFNNNHGNFQNRNNNINNNRNFNRAEPMEIDHTNIQNFRFQAQETDYR